MEIEAPVSKATENLGNTEVTFLKDEYVRSEGRKKLIAPNISCVQRMERIRDPGTLHAVLVVGNRPIAIRTQDIQTVSPADSESDGKETVRKGCNSAGIPALCRNLVKTQRRVAYYENP